MPIATDRPLRLNPVKVDRASINPRDAFQWYNELRQALRTSDVMLDIQDPRDTADRLLIVGEDGNVEPLLPAATNEERIAQRAQLYEAAMAGRLLCYAPGQTNPRQIQTNGKKEFSLSSPWEQPQLQEPTPPKPLNLFQRLMNALFNGYKQEKAEFDRLTSLYHYDMERFNAAQTLSRAVSQMQTIRQQADLQQELTQLPQRKAQQGMLERAYQAKQKSDSLTSAPYKWGTGKARMRPEFSEVIGDKTVVQDTAAEIYSGTEEYNRRTKAEENAEKAGTSVGDQDSLHTGWYANAYLKLNANDFATLGILACGSINMRRYDDPQWNRDPEQSGMQMFEELFDQFEQGEGALYTDEMNEYMFRGRSKAVFAVNKLQGNQISAQDDQPAGELVAKGLSRLCRLVMQNGEYGTKDAAMVGLLRDTLDMLKRCEPLMNAAMKYGLTQQQLEEANGLVAMGEIMQKGYEAQAQLYSAAAENTPVTAPMTVIARVQAMRIVQEDLHQMKQERDELDEDIAEARMCGDEETAKQLEKDKALCGHTYLKLVLGRDKNSVNALYTALKENPNNQALEKMSAGELINQLKNPVTETLLQAKKVIDTKPKTEQKLENVEESEKHQRIEEDNYEENLWLGGDKPAQRNRQI